MIASVWKSGSLGLLQQQREAKLIAIKPPQRVVDDEEQIC